MTEKDFAVSTHKQRSYLHNWSLYRPVLLASSSPVCAESLEGQAENPAPFGCAWGAKLYSAKLPNGASFPYFGDPWPTAQEPDGLLYKGVLYKEKFDPEIPFAVDGVALLSASAQGASNGTQQAYPWKYEGWLWKTNQLGLSEVPSGGSMWFDKENRLGRGVNSVYVMSSCVFEKGNPSWAQNSNAPVIAWAENIDAIIAGNLKLLSYIPDTPGSWDWRFFYNEKDQKFWAYANGNSGKGGPAPDGYWKGRLPFYVSSNLEEWSFSNFIIQEDEINSTECPSVFSLKDELNGQLNWFLISTKQGAGPFGYGPQARDEWYEYYPLSFDVQKGFALAGTATRLSYGFDNYAPAAGPVDTSNGGDKTQVNCCDSVMNWGYISNPTPAFGFKGITGPESILVSRNNRLMILPNPSLQKSFRGNSSRLKVPVGGEAVGIALTQPIGRVWASEIETQSFDKGHGYITFYFGNYGIALTWYSQDQTTYLTINRSNSGNFNLGALANTPDGQILMPLPSDQPIKLWAMYDTGVFILYSQVTGTIATVQTFYPAENPTLTYIAGQTTSGNNAVSVKVRAFDLK